MKQSPTPGFWNIPNVLSLYRLLIFPYILFLIYTRNEKLFTVFITISLITDIADGFIARTFNMQTAIGAKLDSWADLGTYILAFTAAYVFKWHELRPYATFIILFLVAYILPYLLMFIKFGALLGLHTYLFKITAYLQGSFFILLFIYNFYPPMFFVAIIIGYIACLEEIAIILYLKKPTSNVKGLYWLLKEGR